MKLDLLVSSVTTLEKKLKLCETNLPDHIKIEYQNRLALIFSKESGIKDFFLDENKVDKLKREISKKSPLIKSILLKNKRPSIVFDLTGGFGFDTIQLACYGINVIYVEKNPVVFLFFNEFLSRIGISDIALATRIKTLNMDSFLFCDLVGRDFPYPDVVYIDPMFPTHYKRKAKEKKYMQILKEIVSIDSQCEDELFEKAYNISRKKIVIKRPSRLNPSLVNGRLPTYKIEGRGHRFDVYVK